MIAEMVLAELAGGVAKIDQKLGECRGAGPQVGWAAGELRWDHARAQRIHASEKCVTSGRATLHRHIVNELRPFLTDAIDVGGFADHHALMVDARLHPADVVTHDE